MADVNNYLGKRKTFSSQIIFELEGDDEQLPNSPNSENNEPVSKMSKKENSTETTDSNLYQETSQNSIETNASVLEKLTELQEENKKLKKQLEEVSTKVCKCNLNLSSTDEIDNCETHITIRFFNEVIANEYKTQFKNFLKTFIEFTYIDQNSDINITKKKDVDKRTDVDKGTDDDKSPLKKRKRKKSKSKVKDSLFVLDTTPSDPRNETNLKYVSKYLVTGDTENPEKEIMKTMFTSVCFNCEQKHSLRDCPEPKNYAKINAARNKLKQQQLTKPRYHLDDDQKYAHLKAGEISFDLKEALGISSDELPPYIYRMRKCGYPPGWMEDARVTQSNISLFDMDGKESSAKNNKASFDSDKVVEYPGFNMPMAKGVKDEYRYHDCPPYSEKCSKDVMLDYINKMLAKEEDNLEACDMELDQSSDEVIIPPGCEPPPAIPKPIQIRSSRLSPSLTDLEIKKLELLAQLDESITNGSNTEETTDNKTIPNTVDVNKNTEATTELSDSLTLSESFIVIDETGSEKRQETTSNEENIHKDAIAEKEKTENDDSMGEKEKTENDDTMDEKEKTENDDVTKVEEFSTPKNNSVRKSTFGTPLVKSASPFNKLPDSDNFSKDISQVINFENLPNATGKYEQMNGLLQRIRRTLKSSNNNTSNDKIVASENDSK